MRYVYGFVAVMSIVLSIATWKDYTLSIAWLAVSFATQALARLERMESE